MTRASLPTLGMSYLARTARLYEFLSRATADRVESPIVGGQKVTVANDEVCDNSVDATASSDRPIPNHRIALSNVEVFDHIIAAAINKHVRPKSADQNVIADPALKCVIPITTN